MINETDKIADLEAKRIAERILEQDKVWETAEQIIKDTRSPDHVHSGIPPRPRLERLASETCLKMGSQMAESYIRKLGPDSDLVNLTERTMRPVAAFLKEFFEKYGNRFADAVDAPKKIPEATATRVQEELTRIRALVMSEREAELEARKGNSRYDRILFWCRNNRFTASVMALSTLLLAIIGIILGLLEVWEKLAPHPAPNKAAASPAEPAKADPPVKPAATPPK